MTPTITLYSFLYIVITFIIMFTKTKPFYLPMIPINSPELQIIPQSLTIQEHINFLVNISMARASSYVLRESNSSTNSIEAIVDSMPSNYYITQLFIGGSTHLLSPYLLLDTGDDKTWVQCDGCNPCFELKGGGIKAQQSPSYRLLNLDDPRCNPKIIYHWYCGYKSAYNVGGSTSTYGPMATDIFTFINSQTHQPEPFPNLAFGCGMHNDNFGWGSNTGPNNIIAGIFGISPSSRSFLNQLDTTIQGRFSYCLTPWVEPDQGMSTIHFGASAQIVGPNVKQIAMDASHRYHLFFIGISVDGQRVPFKSSLCDLDYSIPKGFLIDSGSPNTVLPESAYQPLRATMVSYFSRYSWQPSMQQGPLDLCYDSAPRGDQSFPLVVFHFKGYQIGEREEIDWVMTDENMFVKFRDGNDGFCMVVSKIPDPGFCLFGAYQQANFRILYDVKNSILSFTPERCQENRPSYDQLNMMRDSLLASVSAPMA